MSTSNTQGKNVIDMSSNFYTLNSLNAEESRQVEELKKEALYTNEETQDDLYRQQVAQFAAGTGADEASAEAALNVVASGQIPQEALAYVSAAAVFLDHIDSISTYDENIPVPPTE